MGGSIGLVSLFAHKNHHRKKDGTMLKRTDATPIQTPRNHARRWLKRPAYSVKFRLESGGRPSSVDTSAPGLQAG